jgi:hypothetical protein
MKRSELLEHCLRIVGDHEQDEIKLSVRAVYYNLVGEGLIKPDSQGERKQYRRVVETIAEAKKAGSFPLDWLQDNLRVPQDGEVSECKLSVQDGLEEVEEYLRWLPYHAVNIARWYKQDQAVMVMAEKDTLEGTLKKPCDEMDVPWFICRGYSSVTGLTAWVEQIHKMTEEARETGWEIPEIAVLYVGDHDPDGLEIPRAAQKVIGIISDLRGYCLPPVYFERLALTKGQALAIGAPPMAVKKTSSRAPAYIAEHGMDAWETEAMDARDLRRRLIDRLEYYFDEDIFEAQQEIARDFRNELVQNLKDPDWIENVLGNL